jgi:hypothetical protein
LDVIVLSTIEQTMDEAPERILVRRWRGALGVKIFQEAVAGQVQVLSSLLPA